MRAIPSVDDAARLLQKINEDPYKVELLTQESIDVGKFMRDLKKKHGFSTDAELSELEGCTEPLGSGFHKRFARIFEATYPTRKSSTLSLQ